MSGQVPGQDPGRTGPSWDAADCRRLREDVAVALLTRAPLPRQVREHAEGCPPCREEIDELTSLGPLLSLVKEHGLGPGQEVGQDVWGPGRHGVTQGQGEPVQAATTPSELLLPRLLREVHRDRRRRRMRLVAAAVVVVAAATGIGVLVGRGDPGTTLAGGTPSTGSAPSGGAAPSAGGASAPAVSVVASASETVFATGEGEDEASGAEMDVDVVAANYGSKIVVGVKEVPPGTRCRLVVVETTGARVEAGSWTVPPGGYQDYANFSETVMTPPTKVKAVELVDDRTRKVLLSVPVVRA